MNLIAGFLLIFSIGSGGSDSTSSAVSTEIADSTFAPFVRDEPTFFSETVLDSFRRDSEFDYHEVPQNSISFFNILRRWFYETFISPLKGTVAGSLLEYVIYGLIIAVSVWLLLRFFNIDSSGIFRSASDSGSKIHFHDSKISSADFDFEKEIRIAAESENYSKAVELEYIFSLTLLNQEKVILWSPEKTNHDFCREISDQNLREHFRHLTTLFEYVWYGDFQIDRSLFSDIQQSFKTFREGIPSFAAEQ